MTTDLSWYYAIGAATDSVLFLNQLGLMAPYQEPFVPFGVEVDASDGLVYGHGFPVTAWRWGFISQAHRNTLKTYCTGKSAIVYIRTRDEDWDFVYCRAGMIWQPENPPSNGIIVDFSVVFRIFENYGASLP